MRFLERIQLTRKRGDTILNGSQSSLVAIFHSGGWCVLRILFCAYTVLRHSTVEDGAYCPYCFVLERPVLIYPWKNAIGAKRGVLANNELSKTHQSAMVAQKIFWK